MATYSIVQKSQLEGACRLDAEYYQPEYLAAAKKIADYNHTTLDDALSVLTDYHANGSYEILKRNVTISANPDFALMIRAVDFENDDFATNVRYVSRHAYEFLKKTKVFGKELIIDKIGKAGTVYLMPKFNRPVTLGMNLFMLRLKENFDHEFVYVFLNTELGRLLISQKITGTVPTSIDKDSVRSIKIPVVSKSFSQQICDLIQSVFGFKEAARDYYIQAKSLLLEELGMGDFKPEEELWSVVNFSNIKTAGRMDAEYFQPKYDKLVEKIKNKNAKSLGELVLIKKGIEPGAEAYQDEGRLFVRVSSLSKYGVEDKDQKYLSEELYQKLKNTYEPKVDEILLTKDATPGIAYVVKGQIEGIISSGILRLKIKDKEIENEYLALCLNSVVGQMQAERDAGGSIIAHWKPEQIKKILIPILPKPIQQKIADLAQKSHEARKKAKELLEQAKQNVEEMIEGN